MNGRFGSSGMFERQPYVLRVEFNIFHLSGDENRILLCGYDKLLYGHSDVCQKLTIDQ